MLALTRDELKVAAGYVLKLGGNVKRYYYTYFDKNYLAKGLALIDSLQEHEKSNYEIFVVCMDNFTFSFIKNLNYNNIRLIEFKDIEKRDHNK